MPSAFVLADHSAEPFSPEAVDSFAPLVPAQAGQRIGDMGAVLGADAIEDAGQEVGLLRWPIS